MNKIFKVIWSKARNCYIVVSEIAHCQGKGQGQKKAVLTCSLAAALAVFTLTGGIATVQASQTVNITGGTQDATNAGKDSIVIGPDAKNESNQSDGVIVIGHGATVSNNGTPKDSIAIGTSANVVGENNIAIGKGAAVTNNGGNNAISLGTEAKAEKSESIAIGMKAHANNNDGIAAIAIGSGSEAQKDKSIAIGYKTLAENNGESGGIAIGSSLVDSKGNIITQTKAAQGNDIAFGVGAQTNNRNMNRHNGGAIAIGHLSYSNGYQDIAIGDNAKTGRTGTEGEGYVAIGANSFSNVGPGVVGYDFKTNGSHNIQTNEDAAAWRSTNGAVSVGNVSDSDHTKWITRQITGVAAGFADTDAVNVAQLKAAISSVNPGGGSGTGGDGVHYYSVLSDETGPDSNYDNKGAKGKNSLAAGVRASTTENAENAVAIGYDTHAVNDSTVAIGSGTQARGRYSVAMGLSSVAGKETNDVNNPLDGGGSVAIGYAAAAEATRSVAIGTGSTAAEAAFTTALGDSASAKQRGSVAVGAGSVATRAAGNKENGTDYKAAYRLPDLTNATDAEIATWTSTEGAVSVGGTATYKDYDANGKQVTKTKLLTRQITNVAAGSEDTDAVNVAQLKQAGFISYKANGGTAQTVTLKDGLDFTNGTNTTAEVGANGVVKFNVADSTFKDKAREAVIVMQGDNVTVKTDADEENHKTTYTVSAKDTHVTSGTATYADNGTGTITLTNNDNSTVTVSGLKNIYTTGVTADAANHKATFNRNDGSSYELKLSDLGGSSTDYQLVGSDGNVGNGEANKYSVANNKVSLNVKDTMSGTTKTVVIDNIASKTDLDNQTISYTANSAAPKKSVKLSEGLNFTDGTNTTAEVGVNGVVKFNVADSTFKDKAREAVVVNAGDNVTVTPAKDETNHKTTYTVSADNMRVKSGTATYNTDGTGTIILTNNDGTTATVSGLKDTYTKSAAYDAANKKATFTRNDNSTYDLDLSAIASEAGNVKLNFQGENTDTTISRGNSDTLSIVGDGTNISTNGDATKSQIKVALNDNLVLGKDGTNGKDGSIGIAGKDGADGYTTTIIKTEKGQPGKDGKNGQPGVNGTDITRIVYGQGQDGKDGKQVVATLDDGQKYAGDNYVAATDQAAEQNVIAKKLNERLDIKGGANKDNLTDKNIGVNAVGGALKVQLAKDLTDLNSVTTGDTVMNSDGLTINKAGKAGDKTITISKTTVSYGDIQVNNMGSGADGKDENGKPTYNTDTNGANIGDVKNIAGKTSTDLTVKGLDFVGNNTDVTVHRDLGTKLTIKGEGTKDDTNYSGENLKVIGDANGSLTIKMDKDIKGNSVTVGERGADGKDGVDGTIGVNGKDGSAVVINGKDGSIGLNGKDGANGLTIKGDKGAVGVDGTDGKNGKDGMTRIVYQDGKDTDHTVATLDDGMKYAGNFGQGAAVKLNKTVTIKGNLAANAKEDDFVDGNIAVTANKSDDNGELLIKLNKNLTGLNSSTYTSNMTSGGTSTTVVDGSGLKITNGPSITYTGIDAGSHVISHVADGKAPTDAVNVSQLTKVEQEATAHSSVEAGPSGNVTVTPGTNKNGGTKYTVDLADNVNFGKGDKKISINGDNGTVTIGQGDKQIKLDSKDGSISAGGVTINKDGKGTVNGLTNTTWDGEHITSGQAATEDQLQKVEQNVNTKIDNVNNKVDKVAKQHTTVSVNGGNAQGNLVMEKTNATDEKGANYDISLSNDVTIGTQGENGKDGKLTVTSKDGTKAITADGQNGTLTFKDGNNETSIKAAEASKGVDGKTDIKRVAIDGHTVATTDDGMKFAGDSGDVIQQKLNSTTNIKGGATGALTDGNIGVVSDGNNTLTVKLAKDIKGLDSVTATTVNATTVNSSSFNIAGDDSHDAITIKQGDVNMGGNTISGVAPGKVSQDSTDAINGSQLWQRDQAINSIGGAVNKLGSRVNRVGAGAAALAALHPLDFDPDDKWDFAAGYGNYRGANAAAVGAYYRPNEDTMFSVGGSFGGGENMVNAGVSFKLGQGNHVSTSRVAMAKEIKDLRQNVANLNAIVNRQSALIDKLTGTNAGMIKDKGNDLFPDVPANHWAYEYVTKLKHAGILTGYPDGNFDGDRMMTRYEFAAIVYRAIMAGAASNPALNQDGTLDKLANEFSSEMKYIRIDTIAKDKNGKPTIERVRVISDAK